MAGAAPRPVLQSTLDAAALIAALEEEFDRVAPTVIATDARDRALLVVVDIRRERRSVGDRLGGASPESPTRPGSPSCASCAARPGSGSWA